MYPEEIWLRNTQGSKMCLVFWKLRKTVERPQYCCEMYDSYCITGSGRSFTLARVYQTPPTKLFVRPFSIGRPTCAHSLGVASAFCSSLSVARSLRGKRSHREFNNFVVLIYSAWAATIAAWNGFSRAWVLGLSLAELSDWPNVHGIWSLLLQVCLNKVNRSISSHFPPPGLCSDGKETLWHTFILPLSP